MSIATTTWSDYGYWTDFLNGRDHRKVTHNTYARLLADGEIRVKLHDTDILTFRPNGEVVYDSGGWLTVTTKDRMNRFGAYGIRISQSASRWYVYKQGEWDAAKSDFYDGLTVKEGVILKPRHAVDPDKKMKAAIDRYVKLYTDEKIKQLLEGEGRGDCLFCQFVTADADDRIGGDHLLMHVKERYVMVHLAYNAVRAAGYNNPAVILHSYPGGVRKAIKRYLRQRLRPNTAGAAGGPKPHADHWNNNPNLGY